MSFNTRMIIFGWVVLTMLVCTPIYIIQEYEKAELKYSESENCAVKKDSIPNVYPLTLIK